MKKCRDPLCWILGTLLFIGLMACIAVATLGERQGGPAGKLFLQPPR